MKLLDAFFGRAETRGVDESISFQDVFGIGLDLVGSSTTAGINVTDDRALCLSAVYGSVRIISEGVSKLPISAKMGAGNSAASMALPPWIEIPSVGVDYLGTGEVIDQLLVSLLLRGNAHVFTTRDDAGVIQEVQVLDPETVEPYLVKGRRLLYRVDGKPGFTPTQISTVIGLSRPGSIKGMSPIDFGAPTIGLGLAAQQFGSAFFGNGANPSGVIEIEEEMSENGAALLRESFRRLHSGKKAGGVAVLSEGAKFKTISISPEQAQFLATREFQVSDIARIFGVPPHLLQDATGSTSWGSGLAEQSVNYVTHTLRPWVERIEALLTRMVRSERPGMTGDEQISIHMSMEHLLRGDYSSRIDTYSKGLLNGIYNLDEIRAFEGLGPLPDGAGQAHRVPLNTAPINEEEARELVTAGLALTQGVSE